MKNIHSVIERLLRGLFGNPWIVCVFVTVLSVVSVWVGIDRSRLTWNRLAVGALFGFSIGIINVAELQLPASIFTKRIFGAAIGFFGGVLSAFLLDYDQMYYFIFSMFGIILGGSARDWARHLNFL